MGKVYGRVIFFRIGNSGPEVLMQLHNDGMLLFPGGEMVSQDGDSLECVVRELSEETQISKDILRLVRNFDLLWSSRHLVIYWKGNRDENYVVQWFPSYEELLVPNEEEITNIVWVPLAKVIQGDYNNQFYTNVKLACINIYDMTLNWTDPLEDAVFVPIDPTTFKELPS